MDPKELIGKPAGTLPWEFIDQGKGKMLWRPVVDGDFVIEAIIYGDHDPEVYGTLECKDPLFSGLMRRKVFAQCTPDPGNATLDELCGVTQGLVNILTEPGVMCRAKWRRWKQETCCHALKLLSNIRRKKV